MKLNKILFTLLAAFSILTVSCQVEEQTYEPGEPDLEGCYGVYFPTQEAAGSHTMDPSETPSVDFIVQRLVADGEITVPVEVIASEEGIFDVPEVRFADGQTETTITVTFDKAQAGVEYTLALEISDPEYALIYGQNPTYLNYSVIIERYDLMGTALYREDLLTALFSFKDPNPEWEVEVYTKETQPGYYFLKNVYQPGICPLFDPAGTVTDTYMVIDATNTQRVIMPFQYIGCDLGYGECAVGSLAPEADFNVTEAEALYGTITNGVITFPKKGLLFGMKDYNDFAFYYANANEMFRIALPGAILTDYTMSLAAGISEDGQIPVQFTFGTDLETIKYVAYEGRLTKADIEEKVSEVMASTTAATVNKPAADAEGNIPSAVVGLSFDKTGEYTIVAVGCDKDGVAQNSASIAIEYVAAGDSVPVMVSAGLGSADKYAPAGFSSENSIEFYIYGKDIQQAKIGLFTTTELIGDQSGCIQELLKSDAIPAEILAEINANVYVDLFTGLTPGTEYYMLVYASNGYEETLIMTDPYTTSGDPLPVYQNFTLTDIQEDLLPAASEGYFGTYNYYAKNLYAEPAQPLRAYQGRVTISDSEEPDIPADQDPNGYGLPTEYVNIKGLYAGDAEYWGFDDTMVFEYYDGVLYTLAWGFDGVESGYYPATMFATMTGSLNFYNYTMIGAYVSEGYLAFMDATNGQIEPTFYLGMFKDAGYQSFAGVGAGYTDALLIKPENDDNGLVPKSAARRTTSSLDLETISFNLKNDFNYVETERGRIHSAIDKMRAEKAPKAVGTIAGIEGEWSAPAAEFTAEEAAPQFKSTTSDFNKVNDAKPALYR